MMKKYLCAFALLALLLGMGAVHAATDASTLSVELLRYEPTPVKPGDTVTVSIQVTNTGGRAAENVKLEIPSSYPFTPAGASDSSVSIGTLAPQSPYVTKVKIAVDRSAPQGTFELPITVSSNDATLKYAPTIDIEAAETAVAIESVQTSPQELVPGSKATMRVTVKNVEQSLVRDLTLSLDLKDTPFIPLGSSAQQKITSLDGGDEQTFTFVMMTAPDAGSSVYKVPLQLNYTSTSGQKIGQQETIGLIVRAEPDLGVVVDEANIYNDGNEGKLQLRLVNKGLSGVKFVEATLLDGEGYEVTGNVRTLYVGNIDSDDFETAEFTIKPKAQQFNLNLALRYRDSLNNGYNETVQVPLHTLDKPAKKPSAWLYVLLALVVIGGIVWWRRSRSKRR